MQTDYQIEEVLAVQNTLGEGPLWHPEEEALYWVDIDEGRFHRLNPATGHHEVFEVGVPLGALAFRQQGGLLLATKNGFAFWDEATQTPNFFTDPEAHKTDARFNDGAVDRQGRFWAGTMGDESNNALENIGRALSAFSPCIIWSNAKPRSRFCRWQKQRIWALSVTARWEVVY